MKANNFDIKLAKAIKAFRIFKGAKQVNMATALKMTEANYCKLEKGYRPITGGELYSIAATLKVPLCQIIWLAEGDVKLNFELKPLSLLIVEYAMMQNAEGHVSGFTNEELSFLIDKIKRAYNK